MFAKLAVSMLGASAAGGAPASEVLIVSPAAAWRAILAVLVFAAVALWFLSNEPKKRDPHEPTSYREAA